LTVVAKTWLQELLIKDVLNHWKIAPNNRFQFALEPTGAVALPLSDKPNLPTNGNPTPAKPTPPSPTPETGHPK
ncbi:MAG: AI-2E family transporter, partial [Cyanobacteria bacterium J06553_1]